VFLETVLGVSYFIAKIIDLRSGQCDHVGDVRNRRLKLGIGVTAMNIGRFCLLLAMAILALAPSTSRGITLGQIDTFDSGTMQGWLNAYSIAPGGPAGISDNMLTVYAAGSGLPLRLQALNQSQWSGNYLAAGVTGIEMDLQVGAPQPSTMPIRIAIRESTSSGIPSGYASTASFTLPNDGQWHHASFSLLPGDLTPVGSPQTLATDLANVAELGIIDAAAPSTQGDEPITGTTGFYVDNIHAVPEPASISILLPGIVGVALLRRRRLRRFE
jgi:hypothetical protein